MALRVDDVDLVRDRSLVERFQAGDEAAFDELYRRYFRRLERFCARRVGEGAEAEELAQEAFARAYKAMPSLTGERRFYPWVSVIAARLCVDSHRRRARTLPTSHVDLGACDGGHDEVERQVDRDLLRQALARLGPRHHEVLVLREQEGWSYQRIADHYGVTLGTVEALLFRARKALRREFAAVAGDDPRLRGSLLGVPGLAWLSRRFAAARARLADVLEPGLPQALAGGAAALAVGSIAVLGTGVGGGPTAPPAAPPPAAVAVAVAADRSGAPVATTPVERAGAPAGTAPASAAAVGPSGRGPAEPAPYRVGDIAVGSGASDGAPGERRHVGPVEFVGDPVTLTVDNVEELADRLERKVQ